MSSVRQPEGRASATPTVSIILVAYNSRSDLERCLPSVEAQSFQDFEIIVVDNYGEDDLAGWLGAHHPQVKVVANASNGGYAGGNNLGLSYANGKFTLILNPDTELHAEALAGLVEAVTRRPQALVTAKLLNPDGTVNACGNELHFTGITTCRGLGKDPSAFGGLHEVPLVSGAALIARTSLLRRLGGFPEHYFMYFEDVALSLRARLAGLTILCAAEAEITHYYSLSMSASKFYYLERNRLLTLLVNYQARTLRQIALALLLTELATWGYACLKGPAYLGSRVRGYSWLWAHRSAWVRERQHVQSGRTLADRELLRDSLSALPFNQLVGNAQVAGLLASLTSPLYRWLQPAKADV